MLFQRKRQSRNFNSIGNKKRRIEIIRQMKYFLVEMR